MNGCDAISTIAPLGFTIRLSCAHIGSNGITASHLQAVVPYSYGGSTRTISTDAAGIRARHRRNQAAQASLSDAMQRWGGMRLAAGDDDTAMQSRFLYRFGTDVMSAQGLAERAALELRDTIMEATRP